jgi:hypothetical protein
LLKISANRDKILIISFSNIYLFFIDGWFFYIYGLQECYSSSNVVVRRCSMSEVEFEELEMSLALAELEALAEEWEYVDSGLFPPIELPDVEDDDDEAI